MERRTIDTYDPDFRSVHYAPKRANEVHRSPAVADKSKLTRSRRPENMTVESKSIIKKRLTPVADRPIEDCGFAACVTIGKPGSGGTE